ncbi:uncharacterized protein LOC114354454 [Ostrinia furnacalis]|uniref:uncharacterized protein LOC114354454 n=1 Tax=Ostrinia furnacalis TaxID=93504 RepID=UPI00103B8CDA|nr:uncharacterized protein LOC114354454 [Ostrinia furnacalis]
MEIEYYDVTAELNAREILRYLNNMGIQNISGEVLKYFITDLKKLIKYDLEQKNLEASGQNQTPEPSGPERLHSASTFSSRIRSKCPQSAPVSCNRDCQRRKPLGSRNVHSAPSIGHRKPETNTAEHYKRSCSCVRVVEKKQDVISKEKIPSSNSNLIKVPQQQAIKKCDPVSLYHHYTSLWAKYKPNVPGENNWSDLRWNVRQKMAGNVPKPVVSKVPEGQNLDKKSSLKK